MWLEALCFWKGADVAERILDEATFLRAAMQHPQLAGHAGDNYVAFALTQLFMRDASAAVDCQMRRLGPCR